LFVVLLVGRLLGKPDGGDENSWGIIYNCIFALWGFFTTMLMRCL
jgi:hypothetical protein